MRRVSWNVLHESHGILLWVVIAFVLGSCAPKPPPDLPGLDQRIQQLLVLGDFEQALNAADRSWS